MAHVRKVSESGLYHVMTRGVAQQQIFHCDRDNKRYLALLKKYIGKYDVQIHAWCLMGNHVHLLPRAESFDQIASMMRLCHEAAVSE